MAHHAKMKSNATIPGSVIEAGPTSEITMSEIFIKEDVFHVDRLSGKTIEAADK